MEENDDRWFSNARANSEQLTLGQLIEAFEEFDKQIKDFDPHSYRGPCFGSNPKVR